MSDEEITTNNSMDADMAPNESPSSPTTATLAAAPSSNVLLDIAIGTGDISDSDDEDNRELIKSKSSTPDSTTLPKTLTKKTLSTHKPSFTKNKSSLVNYEPESDDEEHVDSEEEEDNNSVQSEEDNHSNSNSAVILHGIGELDKFQNEAAAYPDQTIVTSDLLNVTPFKQEDASPSSRSDLLSSHPLMFPEDTDIRIPPEPSTNCSTKLEKKFEEYYKSFKKTGVDQNGRIQALKDFRNPCMYEKMISHLDIDEIGTNFPQELYDPHWWGKESYYEELSKAQKLEIDRREKERKDRAKIGFTPGVKKADQLIVGSLTNSEISSEKRKTRFDQ